MRQWILRAQKKPLSMANPRSTRAVLERECPGSGVILVCTLTGSHLKMDSAVQAGVSTEDPVKGLTKDDKEKEAPCNVKAASGVQDNGSSEDSFSETSYNNSSSSGDTPASGAGMEESHHADDHQHMPTSPLPAPAEKAIETKPEQQKKWYPVGGVEAGPHRSGAQSWGLKESGEEMLERVKRRIDGQRTSEDEKVLSSAEMNLMQNVVCENEEGRWVMDLSCHTSFMSKQNVMS
nr:uncharacterized protein LOC129011671 isoform X1 [Pongo pygmaeus]